MRLLAIDTSTEACSAALYLDGTVTVRFRLAPREHSRLILPMCGELLAEAGLTLSALDGLAFGRGPGAFTGVRIAAGTIQGLGLGSSLPVVPVSSLAALAQGACRELGTRRVLAALDARMGEVYWGTFTLGPDGLVRPAGAECVSPPDTVPLPEGEGWWGVGSGWAAHREALAARLGNRLVKVEPERYPSAEDVAVLGVEGLRQGRAVSAEHALPVYLRDRVVGKG